jgi:site-specific recombinase XerD
MSQTITRFDVALDDYLHGIVRAQPWTKKQDETALTAFGEWLEGQPDVSLSEITPTVSSRYVQAAQLSTAEEQALYAALHRLFSWAEWQELVPRNPFQK